MQRLLYTMLILAGLLSSPLHAQELHWFKGNTHTHSWWSDGDSPPDIVVKWYKDHGYQFLSLTDHNVLSEGERWVTPHDKQPPGVPLYLKTFGPDWIESREKDGQIQYRLKTFVDLQKRFEEPGKFLMIQGEEISDSFNRRPIHLNGINIESVIPAQKGTSAQNTIENDIAAVSKQQKKFGRPMYTQVNHPNFEWALTIEDMVGIRDERIMEIFNGHNAVRNYGDDKRPSAERMWDVLLAKRLAELNLPIVWGIADDDAHCYTSWGLKYANPGRAWIMVHAAQLKPADLVTAIVRGDFYPTTGVTLKEIRFDNQTFAVDIDAKPGVNYKTQFIGTLTGYDPKAADRYKDPRGFLVREYSPTIGQVLKEVEGPRAEYKLTGKEIYVRAKIISDVKPTNPYQAGDTETAWTQPIVPTRSAAAQR